MTSMTVTFHLKILRNIYQYRFTHPRCHQSQESNHLCFLHNQEILINFQKMKIIILNYFHYQNIQETHLRSIKIWRFLFHQNYSMHRFRIPTNYSNLNNTDSLQLLIFFGIFLDTIIISDSLNLIKILYVF